MKCQKCNGKFTAKNMRYCQSCAGSMTLEQKIQAQKDYKAKMQKLHYERLHQFDNQEVSK
jgi:hypothetical protein